MSLKTKLATLLEVKNAFSNWPSVVAGQMSSSGLKRLVLHNGVTAFYRAETEDWEVVKELVLKNAYASGLAHLKQQGGEPIVLDIGANIGWFTLLAASVNAKAIVHSYEPFKKNFELLQTNRNANPLLSNRIHGHSEAVGGEDGTATFYISDEIPQAGSLHGAYLEGVYKKQGRSEQVPVRSLAGILDGFAGPVSLIKMDVEGAEYEIIRNTPASAWQKVKAIAMEIHADPNHAVTRPEMIKRMESFGFSCHQDDTKSRIYFFSRPSLSVRKS